MPKIRRYEKNSFDFRVDYIIGICRTCVTTQKPDHDPPTPASEGICCFILEHKKKGHHLDEARNVDKCVEGTRRLHSSTISGGHG